MVFSFLVRNHYDPSNEPAPWSPFGQDRTAGDAYLDQATRFDEPAGAARAAGLRRLSRLTWRATQLGALATVGFATLFARTAPAATVTAPPHPTPSVKVSSRSPSPSPSPTKTHHRRHHRHHRPRAAPAPSSPGAPAPTLAPPTTPPAPPPPSPKPSPAHTKSSPSHHGGG